MQSKEAETLINHFKGQKLQYLSPELIYLSPDTVDKKRIDNIVILVLQTNPSCQLTKRGGYKENQIHNKHRKHIVEQIECRYTVAT